MRKSETHLGGDRGNVSEQQSGLWGTLEDGGIKELDLHLNNHFVTRVVIILVRMMKT